MKVTKEGRDMSDCYGEVHISGGFIATHETLCGNVDSGNEYEDTDEPVTCTACWEIYDSIKKHRPKFKFKESK